MTTFAEADDLIPDELLELATPAELEAYRAYLESLALDEAAADLAKFETDWRAWLGGIFPGYVRAGFAPHHAAMWEWAWAIEMGEPAPPFVAVWPRGGAKSTSAELACAALGARRRRRYGLYVCETQDQADGHVMSVASLLESPGIERLYPEMARRAHGKFGNPKGWRRNRVWTAAGFVLDAIGLDTAARGIKIDVEGSSAQRPDFIVLDDLDAKHDSAAETERKIEVLTNDILPAADARSGAVLAIQNLVHADSIFARLVDGRAEFLARRKVSGPVPAVEGLVTERREGRSIIIEGTPTWAGQDLSVCQHAIDEYGETAFLSECQHDVQPAPGGMFDHIEFLRCRPDDVPALVRVAVWVDPAVTDKDDSDAHGIQADGLGVDGVVYRLWSWEARTSPIDALCRAIRKAHELGATRVGVETDQGGDTWGSVFREAKAMVEAGLDGHGPATGPLSIAFTYDKAGRQRGIGRGSKAHRASLMLVDYETGANVVHVIGTHAILERALRRFPKTKPYDLVDAAYWSWRDLRPAHQRRQRIPGRVVA